MSEENKFPKKTYCWKMDECQMVITGFHHNQYYVCKKCKTEVTQSLYNTVKDKEPKLDQDSNNDSLDDLYTFWTGV